MRWRRVCVSRGTSILTTKFTCSASIPRAVYNGGSGGKWSKVSAYCWLWLSSQNFFRASVLTLLTTRSLWGPTPIVPGILIRLHSDLNTKSKYIHNACSVDFSIHVLWTIKATEKKRLREGRVANVLLVRLAAFGCSYRENRAFLVGCFWPL